MNDRRRWWYAAAWLFVVGAVAVVSWSAIAGAGREAALLGVPASAARPLTTATPGATQPVSGGPSATAGNESTPMATAPASTDPPAPATPRPSARPSSPTRSTTAGTVPGSTGAHTTAAPVVATVEGSIDVRGGHVAVACRGDQLIFRSAQPADGWSVHTSVGAVKIEVEFRRGEQSTEVSARCVDGAPAFQVDS